MGTAREGTTCYGEPSPKTPRGKKELHPASQKVGPGPRRGPQQRPAANTAATGLARAAAVGGCTCLGRSENHIMPSTQRGKMKLSCIYLLAFIDSLSFASCLRRPAVGLSRRTAVALTEGATHVLWAGLNVYAVSTRCSPVPSRPPLFGVCKLVPTFARLAQGRERRGVSLNGGSPGVCVVKSVPVTGATASRTLCQHGGSGGCGRGPRPRNPSRRDIRCCCKHFWVNKTRFACCVLRAACCVLRERDCVRTPSPSTPPRQHKPHENYADTRTAVVHSIMADGPAGCRVPEPPHLARDRQAR